MVTKRVFDWPFGAWGFPWSQIDRVARQFDQLATEGAFAPTAGVYPLTNLTETPASYLVRAELPGMGAEDIQITLTGKTLAISGERKIHGEKDASYHRRERRGGTFSRVLKLPGEVDGDKVSAASKNGVLTITLPKAEAMKPRQISVKAV